MAHTLFEQLKTLLSQDARFVAAGVILKNRVTEYTLKQDPTLLRLLLSHPRFKQYFFTDADGIFVFDQEKFLRFVNNKAFLPDSYTRFKNKIGLTVNDDYLLERGEVVLTWPYKDCVLEGGQTKEDAKRDEVFWNEILAPDEIDRLFEPKILTNFRRYDADGEHPVTEIRPADNLVIKGNNLLALHSLKKRFAGRVKLIYIDPPYNTENDSFSYNDRFIHSTWLTFMRNRLEVAKTLLSADGFLFIQIDNRELAYLKVLCDEIFGRDNFRNAIIVKKGQKNLQKQFSMVDRLNAGYDTILFYSKSDTKIPNLFKTLAGKKASAWNNHWRGTDRPTMRYELFGLTPETGQWRWARKRTYRAVNNYRTLLAYIEKNGVSATEVDDAVIDEYYSKYIRELGILDHSDFELVRLSKTGKPEHYIPPSDKILLSENWTDLNVSGHQSKFEHEKNERIIERILSWLTAEGDIVLDFFAGSNTTAAVAHKMRRQYIAIEQMDYIESISLERLRRVIGRKDPATGTITFDAGGVSRQVGWQGGGSFVYCELLPWNQRYIDRIKAAQSTSELRSIWAEMKAKAVLSFQLEIEAFEENFPEFARLDLDTQKRILLELPDKNFAYVNYPEIDDLDYHVSDADKKLNASFYQNRRQR